MADHTISVSLVSAVFLFVPHQARSHTACGRLQPLRTAAERTGTERTEAWAGWVVVEEPVPSHSPKSPRCKHSK